MDGRFVIHNNPPVSPFEKGGLKEDLKMGEGASTYGFQVASYNKNLLLIIDPVLVYSTYLGGSGDEYGYGIAIDATGNTYVTGYTDSTNFPTANPIQGSNAGWVDAFVTKINVSGTGLIYSTYLGGSSSDGGNGIAVDTSGNAYVTGWTFSTNFPTVNSIQGGNGGTNDAFVTKISPSGSVLTYSTYLGGSSDDRGYGIAVDGAGNAYITGFTESAAFPTANPIQGCGGYSNAFITKINTSGTALVYSTCLGGTSSEAGYGIAVDTPGNVYVTGYTGSANFPTLNPIQGSYAGSGDAFVTKINASGISLVYSTYLGGNGTDEGGGIAVDSSGNAYITGTTYSTNFPTVNPIQGSNTGSADTFVAKISPIISGCIQLNGSPVVGSSVTLKQKRETDQITTTNISGCYHFDTAVSGKTFQVIINGPSVP